MPEEPEVKLGQVFVFLKVQSADVMHKLFRDLLIFHSSVVLHVRHFFDGIYRTQKQFRLNLIIFFF